MTKRKLITLALLFLVNVFIWNASFRQSKDKLVVAFLDVGQGDAVFIESPTGNQVLIDGGRGRSVLRELGSVTPFYDRSIDVLIATHPDADHVGGLPEVLNNYKVSFVLDPGVAGDTALYKTFQKRAMSEHAKYVLARRGQVIDLGGGAYIKILFPDRDVRSVESNAGSVFAQLVYGETEVMLTGDAPRAIEKYVVSLDTKTLASDVLKAGHHGSRTSSDELFVGWVSPEYTVISAGKDNRYGHPHREVLDTLDSFETKTLATYERGTIVFESDGENFRLR